MKKVISVLIVIQTLLGCNFHQDPVKYAEDIDNGLKKEVAIGDIHYIIQYKPSSFIVEKEHLEPTEAKKRMKNLKGMIWLNVSFSVNNFRQSPLRYKVTGLDEYIERQNYYLNQAPRDMCVNYGDDSLKVDSYWFENNQNLAPFETMVIGFKLPVSDSLPIHDIKFSFYDRVFKNGIVKSTIKAEDIASFY